MRQDLFDLPAELLQTVSARPIAELEDEALVMALSTRTNLSWTLGPVSLEFGPQAEGSVAIRRVGEVFRFTEAEKDDDPARRQVITVPDGKAYVSIQLRVSIGVSAAGGFSGGTVGVKASASTSDTFLIANHCLVDASQSVAEGIKTAFENFVMPFQESAYRSIPDGNFLEYQCYGNLTIGMQAAFGFQGVLFGGVSGGDLRRSLNSPVGSITARAKPEANLSASFSLGWQHEDAFRMVLRGMADTARLYVFKMDRDAVSAALRVNAGVSLNAAVNLKPHVDDLIAKSAQRLFADVPSDVLRNKLIGQLVAKASGAASAEVNAFTRETQQKIQTQIKRLDRLNVSAGLAFERISEHAALLSLDFERAAPPDGYSLAMHGDMAAAVEQPGTSLAPGSYMRSEIRRTTSMSVQLFNAFQAKSIDVFFEKSELRYKGQGVFQLMFQTGRKAESNVFGHNKSIEFGFEIAAEVAASGLIGEKDVHLRIATSERNNVEAARRTASMLHLILSGSAGEGVDAGLRAAIEANAQLSVHVVVALAPDAYRRLPFSALADRRADALNYGAFVEAVDLMYAGSGFGTQGFPDAVSQYEQWALFNINAIDSEESTRPPNRRETGNTSRWPVGIRTNSPHPMLVTYMLAAQQFMNLCEDLPRLAQDLDTAQTKEAWARVLKSAGALVAKDSGAFPIYFTKPLLVALLKQCGGRVQQLHATEAGDAFEVVLNFC
ncbi:MAG: hypothetical protein HYZ37_00585 [Candidatus Solibacter usitatus]|nr:hypothetical protein [Candidatus Solibacter usitatus]